MVREQFKTFSELLSKGIAQAEKEGGFIFDDRVKDLKSLWELLDARKDIVGDLKSAIKKKSLKAKDWVPDVAQVDFMSRSHRDLKMRFRSRIGCFNRLGRSGTRTMANLEATTKNLEIASK